MMSSPTKLGTLLDGWVSNNQVSLIETASSVTASRMSAKSAGHLASLVVELGWSCNISDSAGSPVTLPEVEDDFGPFIVVISKPISELATKILTRKGMEQTLKDNDALDNWQCASNGIGFYTGKTAFRPWGDDDKSFVPDLPRKRPIDIVRDLSQEQLLSQDIRQWLLQGQLNDALWSDKAFETFAHCSCRPLIFSLASEIIDRNTVIFNGPPRLNMAVPDGNLADLGIEGYRNLQAAVHWVYEDKVSAEQRHALFAAEFSRSVSRGESIGEAFRNVGRDALEGARFAFQLSQSDISREAIKAQADLRKSIADDTSKAADSTRTLLGATAVAIVTGITMIAAKSSGATEPWVLSLITGIVAIYLWAVAYSGWAYLKLQRELRRQWKARFYRFVPAEDYEAMVTKPARTSERPYSIIAVIAACVGLVLFIFSAGNLWTEWRVMTVTDRPEATTTDRALPNIKEAPTIAAPPKPPAQ